MEIEYLLTQLEELRDVWYATEKTTGENIWGECAHEIDVLIEKAEDGK